MARNDKERYYWIKLSNKFITSQTVDFLMSQQDGANYVVLYQMLCLMTINTNGEMANHIGEVIIPFDEAKIARDTKYFSIDTVRIALALFQKLGLIYLAENGILKIADYERLVGSETESALRHREAKMFKKSSGAELGQKMPLEIRVKSQEIRDIELLNKNNFDKEDKEDKGKIEFSENPFCAYLFDLGVLSETDKIHEPEIRLFFEDVFSNEAMTRELKTQKDLDSITIDLKKVCYHISEWINSQDENEIVDKVAYIKKAVTNGLKRIGG